MQVRQAGPVGEAQVRGEKEKEKGGQQREHVHVCVNGKGECTKWKFMTETRRLLSFSTLEIIRPSFLMAGADEIYHNYRKTLLIISFPILIKTRDILFSVLSTLVTTFRFDGAELHQLL